MIKKIAIVISSAIFGLLLSLFLDAHLKNLIVDIYVWATNGKIQFVGKNFLFLPPAFSMIGFAFSFSIVSIDMILCQTTNKFKVIAFWIFSFLILLTLIASFQAHLRIIECTVCNNGIRSLNYNQLEYGFTIGVSTFLSTFLSFLRLIKKAYNKVYSK